MNNRLRQILLSAVLLGALTILWGCSTDENPVSPQKMSEIRKQEGDQRAKFNPSMDQPQGR